MATTEAVPLKAETQKPPENSNENNQRGPGGPGGPGIGGGRGGRGRKGGSRFSGGRGGGGGGMGMGMGGGGPGRNDGGGPGRNDNQVIITKIPSFHLIIQSIASLARPPFSQAPEET